MDWFKIWKEYIKAVYYHPCLFHFFSEYIMGIAQLDKSQAENKIANRNVNNLRYADDTTLMAESEEELKSPLIGLKEESEKADLKLNIQKAMIMASGPLNSWQRDGKKLETVTDFIFLGSKVSVNSDYSHKIKKCLLLGRKAMTKLCCCCSVTKLWLTLCNPMDYSMPGFPVLHHLPELAQTHVHWIIDAIKPFHPL